jgi:hypothetical protein
MVKGDWLAGIHCGRAEVLAALPFCREARFWQQKSLFVHFGMGVPNESWGAAAQNGWQLAASGWQLRS